MKYMEQATELAEVILAQSAFQGPKAHPHCRLFRGRCWLSQPQPECRDCKYLPLEDALKA